MADREICYRCWPGYGDEPDSCPHCASLNGEYARARTLIISQLNAEIDSISRTLQELRKKRNKLEKQRDAHVDELNNSPGLRPVL